MISVIILIEITSLLQGQQFYKQISQSISKNVFCEFWVNQTYTEPDPYIKQSIQESLSQQCSEGYDIILLTQEHVEAIVIRNATQVLIKGGAKQDNKQVRTTWVVNSSANYTIYFECNLTLQNLEFNSVVGQDDIIWPKLSIIEAIYFDIYKTLTIISCIFNGLGNDQFVPQTIIAYMLDKLEIRDCVFQNSKRDSSSLIFYQMNQDNSELIVDNCHFENITLTEGGATIDIHTIGDKELISINKCVFTNCIGELKSVAGSIYINQKNKYNDKCIITNNKFINCSGQQAGGIYIITYIVNINISNNIFIGNSINGTYGSEDAFLEWYYFPEGWSRANIKSKVEPIFQGCISTVDNSVFYLVDYFATNPTSGYIQLQQYCKSQIELTRDCICNPDSQSYPIDQCSQDKSCSYDLIHQNQSYCPCLNSGDPRAGKGECPAYCIKGQVTPDCVCDTGSSSYPESTCEIDKLCVIDLAHQSTNDCPCLSTGDPRAGNTCPAYCTGPDIPTQDCVCDSNPSAQYPPQTCQSDQKCNKSSSSTVPKDSCTCTGTNYPSGCKCPTDSSQLNGIPSSRCECRTSGDPRAGNDICPAYCIKESITPDCVCETNSSSYTTSTCQTDKLCLTDLVHQNIIDCPCQSTADPRNGSFCPVYCMKGYVSINCVCDTNSTIFPLAQCQKDMLCATDLVHQSASDCPCLPTGDPRAGNTCPAYCTAKDQPNEECVCDSNPNAKYSPQTCQSDKKCTASSSSTVPKDSCTCSGTNYPSGCKCPTDQSQLTGIPKEICECRTTGDPRANGICPAYCTGPNIPTSSCVCDSGSTNYPFTTCQSEKNCTVSSSSTIAKDSCKCTTSNYPTGCKCSSVPQELVGIPKERCECLPTGELRAGGICPLYCTSKDQPSSNCACDINSSSYPPSLCQSEKQCNVSSSSSVPTDSCTCTGSNYPSGCKCPTDSQQLNDIPIEKCECRSTSDPRAGKGQCPAYCTGPDIPTSDCVCDSNPSAQYPPQLCQSDKNCTTQSGSSVPQDSCSCTIKNYPSGCKCPTNSSQLIGIPLQICDCRTSGDPRAGGACPAYCVKGYTNAYCVCDTNSSSYPSEYCEKDKLCITDLIHQTKADCPCLMKGDPRAGDVCPSYCISKSELTIECMCELGSSSYPQAQCERDKLCIVDLIHQSTSNCPCLAVDDPRGESVCKQTEINPSDPDPTDPIIPDPSEKDPETDQEQEQESEPKQDDEDEQKKEESSSTILISIIIPVVGLLIIAIIVVIAFFIFRSRNKNKLIKKEKEKKDIEMKEEKKEKIKNEKINHNLEVTVVKPQKDTPNIKQTQQLNIRQLPQSSTISNTIVSSSPQKDDIISPQQSISSNIHKTINSPSSVKTNITPDPPSFKVDILSLSSYEIKSNRRSSQLSNSQRSQSSSISSRNTSPITFISQNTNSSSSQSSHSNKSQQSLNEQQTDSKRQQNTTEKKDSQKVLNIHKEIILKENRVEKKKSMNRNQYQDKDIHLKEQSSNKIEKQNVKQNEMNIDNNSEIHLSRSKSVENKENIKMNELTPKKNNKDNKMKKAEKQKKKEDQNSEKNKIEIEKKNLRKEIVEKKSKTRNQRSKRPERKRGIKIRSKVHTNKDDDDDDSSDNEYDEEDEKTKSHSRNRNRRKRRNNKNKKKERRKKVNSESSSESSSSITSSSSSFSSSSSSSSQQSQSQPISSSLLYIPNSIEYALHQSFTSENSFKTVSESHRESLNQSRSQSLSSNSQQSKASEQSDISENSRESQEIPEILKLSMWKKYLKYLPPEDLSQSSIESTNIGERKDDESPNTSNTNNSNETDNKE